jgi:hypothetical protein
MKTIKTREILENMREQNFNRKWSKAQIAEWVLANYNCSRYVANQVSILF